MNTQPSGYSAPRSEQEVIAWLQENARPIQHVEAGSDFSDLQPLKQILKDVKVVGLGETTHGTREMFLLKHRLVEFLVTEMDFNTFTIESSFATCQAINDYILHGAGDRAAALTSQWYVPWDTEEVSDLLDWTRAYNQSAPDGKKVEFYGLDITRNDNGRKAVLEYMQQVAPDRVAATATLFEALAKEEVKWLTDIDDETEEALVRLLPQLQGVIDHLMANKASLVNASSWPEFNQVLHYTQVMKQFVAANAAALRPPTHDRRKARSQAMGENLLWLAEQAKPEAKYIVWAHNAHVRVVDASVEAPNMGSCLREKFGQAYFACGFEFNQGAFLTRTRLPEMLFGNLKEVILPPSPPQSLAWYLAHTKQEALLLDLRLSVANPTVKQWLATPQPIHFVSWGYDDQAQDYLEMRSLQEYDAMVFFDKTTASRPTANALKRVAMHEGL